MTNAYSRREFLKGGVIVGTALSSHLGPASTSAGKLKEPYSISDEPLTRENWHLLKSMTERVFSGNRVVLSNGIIHVPSVNQYVSLFGWDSGWHAIAMTRMAPNIAASEIDVLFSFQEENGRVSHNTELKEIQKKPGFKSQLAMLLGKSQYDEIGRSAMIDPPSYIIAVEKIYEKTRDRAWLDRMLPRMEACIKYLTKERDLFGDGLVSVIHPWETGTDSSPAYDKLLGLEFGTPLGAPIRGLLYPRLLDYNARFGWDPQEVKKKNRFVLEDICFNSITIRAVLSVARLNRELGEKGKADEFLNQARSMMDAVDRINWVESEGCYFSRYDVKDPRLAMRTTASSMLPMLTGLISPERADRIVKEHLTNPQEFWLPFVVSFNAKDELDREKVYFEDLLLWRGHCIWTNMNWMITEALMAYGYTELAREITRLTARMILHEGLYEFYDYRNGQGKGAADFNWPGLVLDMIAVTWPEIVT
jgi:glycogen debranching enzyme